MNYNITSTVDDLFLDTSSVIYSKINKRVLRRNFDEEITLDDLTVYKRNKIRLEAPDADCLQDIESISLLNDEYFLRDLDELDVTYPIKKKDRGCFLIFNHVNFYNNLKLSSRPCSVKDANELKELFEKELKFSNVKIFQDLPKDEILNWLTQS